MSSGDARLDGDNVAWADVNIRLSLRRPFAVATSWLVLGLLGLVPVLASITNVENAAARLRQMPSITATVIQDSSGTYRCSRTRTPLSYEYEGRRYSSTLLSDDCSGQAYVRGDQIPLYIDPADPAHFVTQDSNNQSGPSTAFDVVVLVVCLLVITGACVTITRQLALRSLLSSAPWERTQARLYGDKHVYLDSEGPAASSTMLLLIGSAKTAGFTPRAFDAYTPLPVEVLAVTSPSTSRWAVKALEHGRPLLAKPVKIPQDLRQFGKF